MYSWGAPDDQQVWTSVACTEVMYENGVVDASAHSADGKYWSRRISSVRQHSIITKPVKPPNSLIA